MKYAFILILLVVSNLAFCSPDSDERKLQELREDVQNCSDKDKKISLLLDLSNRLRNSDLEEAIAVAKKAQELAVEIGSDSDLVRSLNLQGMINKAQENLNQAKVQHKKAVEIALGLQDSFHISSSYNNLANTYIGNPDSLISQLNWYLKSLNYTSKKNNIGQVFINLNIYFLHKKLEKFDAAQPFLETARRYAAGQKDPRIVAYMYNAEVMNLWLQKDYDAALNKNRAYLSYLRSGNNKFDEIGALLDMADILEDKGEVRIAQQHILEAQKLSDEIGVVSLQEEILFQLADSHYKLNDYPKAIRLVKKAIEICPYDVLLLERYEYLANIYAEQGDYKAALDLRSKIKPLEDSLSAIELRKTFTEFEVRYNTKSKELENQQLRIEQSKSEAQLEKRLILIFALIVLQAYWQKVWVVGLILRNSLTWSISIRVQDG